MIAKKSIAKKIKKRDNFASILRIKDENKIQKVAMPAGSEDGELQKYP